MLRSEGASLLLPWHLDHHQHCWSCTDGTRQCYSYLMYRRETACTCAAVMQILRWQATSAHQQHTSNTGADGQAAGSAARKRTRAASRAADAEDMGSSKPRLVLSLQDAAQLPAALAVLAALYSVKPIPELLSTLPQEQQLHAALLADTWQVADVSTAAVQLLVDAAKPDQGLSAAAYDQFMGLGATPTCLLPLFKVLVELLAQFADPASQATLKRMLLSVLGDLEDVWADPALRKTLLSMPLTAMTVLLGCNELKVGTGLCALSQGHSCELV